MVAFLSRSECPLHFFVFESYALLDFLGSHSICGFVLCDFPA